MSLRAPSEDTLTRVRRTGQRTYLRTLDRKVEWPVKDHGQRPEPDPDPSYTTLDEAFTNFSHFMSQASRQCKRYYNSHPPRNPTSLDACHCNRYHTAKYRTVKSRNPLQRSEDVNIVVDPGSYAISAGQWGSVQQQNHVVHIQDGDMVELDFML